MKSTHGERFVGAFVVGCLIGLPIWSALGSGKFGMPALDLPSGLARPPHIALLGTDEATIAYSTIRKGRGGIEYGRPGEPGVRIELPTRAYDHAVEVGGLAEATHYTYRVLVDGSPVGVPRTFRTAPSSSSTVRIVALGDSGTGGAAALRIVKRTQDLAPHLVLHLGDMAYPHATPSEVARRFEAPFAELRASVPMLAAFGNHDFYSDGGRPLLDALVLPRTAHPDEETYYHYDFGPVRCICINTEIDLSPSSPQGRWLAGILPQRSDAWRIVFGHRPPFAGSRSKGSPEVATHVVPLLEQHKIDLYLSGHDHLYMRSHPIRGGVPVPPSRDGSGGETSPNSPAPSPLICITSGGGGMRLYAMEQEESYAQSESVHHVVALDVSPETLTVRAIDVEGKEFDRVALARR